MFKKIASLCLFLFAFHSLNARVVPLETGRWLLDTYRNVEIDDFDYTYQVESVDASTPAFTLQDGSVWQVVPMEAETLSFYRQRKSFFESIAAPESIFEQWKPGDILIFHKIVNRPSLLAYNITRDHLLDVAPIQIPVAPALRITSITNTNDTFSTYDYNSKTGTMSQKIHNNWRTVIALSDGTVWEGDAGRPILSWVVGDAVLIAKDTPYWSCNTHMLLNIKASKKRDSSVPYVRRLGTRRVG
ncbi:MAG: hypothetical protein JSR46_11985 [Verrucomicrobia bacterium]|nr:hypothetical protein [Verrucomicrobiota bacterium]